MPSGRNGRRRRAIGIREESTSITGQVAPPPFPSTETNDEATSSEPQSLIDAQNVVIADSQFNQIRGPYIVLNVNPSENTVTIQGSPSGPVPSSETDHISSGPPSTQSTQPNLERTNPQTEVNQTIFTQKSNEIYERHLISKGRGFPLWIPDPNEVLHLDYRRTGVRIGDVGIINSSGGFSFLFNICLPHDHPVNPRILPEHFAPISPPIEATDIEKVLEFKNGSHLASASIKRSQSTATPGTDSVFESSASEGAILIMPRGARSEDYRNFARFKEYAAANVADWYKFVNGPRGREAKNGDVRLVYGFDKTTSWGIATFVNQTQQNSCRLKFGPLEGDSASTYTWSENSGVTDVRAGPDSGESDELRTDSDPPGFLFENQCLFVRTLNVTLTDDVWADIHSTLGSVRVDPRHVKDHNRHQSSSPSTGGGSNPSSSAGAQYGTQKVTGSIYGLGNVDLASDNNPGMFFSGLPERLTAHPSKVLNDMLLAKVPTAKMAITHDDDWSSVITQYDSTLADPYYNLSDRDIAANILMSREICEENGVIFLQPKEIPNETVTQPGTSLLIGNLNHPASLGNLAISVVTRSDQSDSMEDLEEAIIYHFEALSLCPIGHPDRSMSLNNLASAGLARYREFGGIADLEEVIIYHREALGLCPAGHPDHSMFLDNLASALLARYRQLDRKDDLEEAVTYRQKAVFLTPEDHADMPSRLSNLGNSFMYRFQVTGDLADISDAITYQQKAVHLTPEGHADMPSRLSNLGKSFMYRFQVTGDLADISDAISYQQKAVHLTPESHADMPSWLSNLGNSFMYHFQVTGDLADISDAITYQQKAVHLTPEGHADMPSRLSNLGKSFMYRFQVTGDLADISNAISYQQKAVHLTPEGHADMPSWLSNLGNSFMYRFQATGNLADFSDAISYQQTAVHLTPEGHTDMPSQLSNLGNSFMYHFQVTEDLADISNAISYHQKAVHLTPEGHTDMPNRLINLGNSFMYRFQFTGDLADIHTLLSIDRQCATYSSGPPSMRLRAAIRWAQHSSYDPPQSLEAYNTAIQLVSQVAGLEQTIQKRHTNLNLLDISDLAVHAAACAFKFERPGLALEWFEQGRYLIWSQLNNLQTPLDALFAHDSEIATEMLRVSRALENLGSRGDMVAQSQGEATMEHKMSLQDEAITHVKLTQKWNELLTKIRTIPKFEDFLQPPSCSKLLKNLPDSGLVAVINVHKNSCDALVLSLNLDEPLHIPLHKFSYAKATDLRNLLNTHLCASNVNIRGTRPLREDGGSGAITYILHQLWILVVKPILDGLGFSEPPSNGKLSHIWWCATGPLAFLPIHAAGLYATSITKAGPTLSDFAISSYIPNVRALTERVDSTQVHDKRKTAFFMISQPATPNLPRIPGTTKEVLAIKKLLQNHNVRFLCLEGEAATVNQGITNMESHSCIHFACHAHQNTQEPLKSKFMLHDGGLEFSDIIKRQLVGADLAYLSACQTSTGNEKFSEEAVHLAAGMLAAGYRGVVATMWSISDQHGPQVAEDFYAGLISQDLDGLSGLSTDNAASALHYATQKLRKQLGDFALDWIPYVHYGM